MINEDSITMSRLLSWTLCFYAFFQSWDWDELLISPSFDIMEKENAHVNTSNNFSRHLGWANFPTLQYTHPPTSLWFCHRNRYNSTSPMSIWPWRPPLRMPERLVWPPQLLRQLPRVTWTKRRWEGWQMKCRGRWNNMDSKVQSLEKRRQGRFWGLGSFRLIGCKVSSADPNLIGEIWKTDNGELFFGAGTGPLWVDIGAMAACSRVGCRQMGFLARMAPDIPWPFPHSKCNFITFHLIFMSTSVRLSPEFHSFWPKSSVSHPLQRPRCFPPAPHWPHQMAIPSASPNSSTWWVATRSGSRTSRRVLLRQWPRHRWARQQRHRHRPARLGMRSWVGVDRIGGTWYMCLFSGKNTLNN